MSMTGYGRGTGESERRSITVELKSLNSKQFDLQVRMPQDMREHEVEMRNAVASALERGKVEMSVSVEMRGAQNCASLDTDAIKEYKQQIEALGRECGLPEPADWYMLLLRMPDVMRQGSVPFDDDDAAALARALDNAISALSSFRLAEGRKLYAFFCSKIEALKALLVEVEPCEAERVPKIKSRLEEQLRRLDSVEYDRGRLEQEMIFYIEKLDVTEEKTRLRAHLNYFLETMGTPEDNAGMGQGKKLGFIAQEMGREINTLGSKSNHAEMQKIVVRMKDELEQIKEQVLNVL